MAETDEQALRELDRIYDPEAVLHYGETQAIRTRAQVLADVAGAPWGYRAFTRRPDYVAIHGDIGVTMGSELVVPDHTHPAGGAADQPLNRRYTHVYRRRNGAWTLLVRHVNHVGDG